MAKRKTKSTAAKKTTSTRGGKGGGKGGGKAAATASASGK